VHFRLGAEPVAEREPGPLEAARRREPQPQPRQCGGGEARGGEERQQQRRVVGVGHGEPRKLILSIFRAVAVARTAVEKNYFFLMGHSSTRTVGTHEYSMRAQQSETPHGL
jgi:hypothetical protein